MGKWSKVLIAIIVIVGLSFFILFKVYLSPDFVDEPDLSSVLQTKIIAVDGMERTFHYYTPAKLKLSNTIVYVLHGSRSDGIAMRKSMAYEFDKIADREGLVIVYPTGFENHWNDCRASADYSANLNNIDDITFFKKLEFHLQEELDVQFDFRFATGHSNGGHLCFKLALEYPEWIDGIAPISANLPIDENLDCKKQEKFVPICLMNGTADKINPYNGGLVEIMGNSSRGSVLSTDETMMYWMELRAELGNCLTPMVKELEDKVVSDQSTVQQTMWICDSKLQAINYKIEGGGHVIPHPQNEFPAILGTMNQDLNGPQAIWSFFNQIRSEKL